MKKYSKSSLPSEGKNEDCWRIFRKKATTKAIRIDGPFEVETTEGTLSCQDGWLAIDSRGFPYPIADDEFQQIYAEVE